MNMDIFTKFISDNNSVIDLIVLLTGIIAAVVNSIVKLFITNTQNSKKENVTRISKVADIYVESMIFNCICLIVTIVFLYFIAYWCDMVLKLSNGEFVWIASIIIIVTFLIFNICSKKRRKRINDSFNSRIKINKFLFYLPVLLIVLGAITTLYLSFMEFYNNYINILNVIFVVIPSISLMFYFMAIKKICKYKNVDIYFNNAYNERNISYKKFSHEDRFVVIISDDKLTYKKYNIDNIAKIVINLANIEEEYQKHLKIRGFIF